MEKRRVVITGLGTVNPLGTSVSASWDAVKAGKCGIGPITQFDTTDFKCKLAGEVKDFDPETMNAVMHIEDENFGENEVSQVFQAGFELNGKVLRHAIVQVAN